MKKFLLCALFAVLAWCQAGAFTYTVSFRVDGICYYINQDDNEPNTVTVVKESGDFSQYTGNVVIPDNVTYRNKTYAVNRIATKAFYCAEVDTVIVGNNVKYINLNAFSFSTLKKVVLGNSVEEISGGAFSECDLTEIDFPASLRSIDGGAFENCKLLTSVTIPEGLTSISEKVFDDCKKLTTLIFNARDCTGRGQFLKTNTLTHLEIGDSVRRIPRGFIMNQEKITHVDLPESVTNIDAYAFAYTGIEEITIGKNVKYINYHPFSYCKNLKTIEYNARNCERIETDWASEDTVTLVIGPDVESMPSYMLATTKAVGQVKEVVLKARRCTKIDGMWAGKDIIQKITICDGVEVIPPYLLYNQTTLDEIKLPSSVTSIGAYAFGGCTTSIDIPDSVENIDYHAFDGCTGMTKLDLKNVATLGVYAFANCTNAKSLNLGSKLTQIPDHAFDGCTGLEGELALSDSIVSIGDYAFKNCTGVTSLYVGKNLKRANGWAFDSCKGIKSITFNARNANGMDSYWLYGVSSKEFTIGPDVEHINLNYNAGQSTANKINFLARHCVNHNIQMFATNSVDTIVIAEDVDVIPVNFANYQGKLESITIPDKVTCIGEMAFYQCSNLKEVTWPSSLTKIEHSAFQRCKSLPSIEFPQTLKTIGRNAFAECDGLTEITLPDSTTNVGQFAFALCKNLKSFKLSPYQTLLDAGTFDGCTSLAGKVELAQNLETVEWRAFGDCTQIESLVIGRKMKKMIGESFTGCTGLKEVHVQAQEPPTIGPTEYDGMSCFANDVYKNATLFVPAGKREKYNAAKYWKNFEHIEEEGVIGDINGDGEIDVTDMNYITNIMVGKEDGSAFNGDINGDGVVDVSDLNAIVNMMLGK